MSGRLWQLTIFAAAIASANAQPRSTPKFEVASIRLCDGSDPGGRNGGGQLKGGGPAGPSPDRLRLVCQPAFSLIRQAYVEYASGSRNPMNRTPIEGAPGWANSDRYMVTAKADGTPGDGIMRGPMMRALLEERFKLKIRSETRQVPAYDLTIAKSGPQLKAASETTCIAFDFSKPLPPPDGKYSAPCADIAQSERAGRVGRLWSHSR